jgi:hypothetical protein
MKKHLKTIENGKQFDFGGYNWTKLDNDLEGGTLVLMTEILCDKAFDDENENDWRESSLREYLNTLDGECQLMRSFIEHGIMDKHKLDIETNLLPIISDLASDDGMKDYGTCEDYIALLSCKLYMKYRNIIPPIDNFKWHWTLTPLSYRHVRLITELGRLNASNAWSDSYGVRPLCRLKSGVLVHVDSDGLGRTPVKQRRL